MKKAYNAKDKWSILEYSKLLLGKSLEQAIAPEVIEARKGKGRLGQLVEEYFFGYDVNSNPDADFSDAGLELKVTPLKELKNKVLAIKERLVAGGFEDVANGEFAALALQAARMLNTPPASAPETGVAAGLPPELEMPLATDAESDSLDNSALFEGEDGGDEPVPEAPAAEPPVSDDPWSPPPRLGPSAPEPAPPAAAGDAPLMRGILARLRKANDKAAGARERFNPQEGA